MVPGSNIDLRGWMQVGMEVYHYHSDRAVLEKVKNRVIKKGEKRFAAMRIHQKNFGEVTTATTVRSIYFFDRGPYIQLWRCEDTSEYDENANFLDPAWQRDFYKIIKINEDWYQLEPNEIFKISRVESNKDVACRIFIEVINHDDANKDRHIIITR